MVFTDTIERVAVTDKETILADKVRYMSGDIECSIYKVDELWDYKKESLEEFCRRNINFGGSETINEKEIDKRFEEEAKGSEYDRYEIVDYSDVYEEGDGSYFVNNVSRDGKLFAPKSATDNDLIEALKADNFFAKTEDNKEFTVTGDDILVEIEKTKNGYPLCRLEKEETAIHRKKEKEKKKQRL